MNIANFRVEPADFHVDYDDLHDIRETVFVAEQKIPKEIEFDNLDDDSYHFIARDFFHQAIGSVRLTQDHKIGRMAVLSDWRRKGVGKALLQAALDKASRLGYTEVALHAQTAVLSFYEQFGFTKEGAIFLEADIPHQLMRKQLPPREPAPGRPEPKPRDAIVEITEFQSLDAAASATVNLVNKARKQICIFTLDLEPNFYGRNDIAEALKQFAITSGGGTILIIVQDTLAARSQPHPLIDLAQRLPSAFLLRTPVEGNDLQYPSAFIVNDRDGYLFRQQSSQYRGVWSPTMPARNKQLLEEFDRMWQRSRVCTEFRALGL